MKNANKTRVTKTLARVLRFVLTGIVLAQLPDGFIGQDIVAEAAECQGASNPVPTDGGFVCPLYDGDNVYVFLEYTSSPCATGFLDKAYCSDNRADVDNRDEDHWIGTVPPGWPFMPFVFVVGYDDPTLPEAARDPLVPGTTYYWCLDSWDGENYILGPTWSFTPIPQRAWGPSPEDGEEWIPHDGTMTWNRGDVDTEDYSLSYDIYIGIDHNAVALATSDTPEYVSNVTVESYEYNIYDDGPHFWRVDTVLRLVRPPFTSSYYTGNVWSFFPSPVWPTCYTPDFYPDNVINFKDYAVLAADWHKSGPGLEMDISKNLKINYNDLRVITGFWLWQECEDSPDKAACK